MQGGKGTFFGVNCSSFCGYKSASEDVHKIAHRVLFLNSNLVQSQLPSGVLNYAITHRNPMFPSYAAIDTTPSVESLDFR